jgi:Protein of unknown function (DUF1501)
MLTLFGKNRRTCDGISRRGFIQVGAVSFLGLSLPQLLRAESANGESKQHTSKRSVILIWQHGGPSQLDTFDMKPEAPAEIRGPWRSIETNVPGIYVSELCQEQAKVMDKCTIIRSFSHGDGDHWAAAHWMLTGHRGATGSDRVPRNPSMSAISSLLLGPRQSGVPSCVNINDGGFGFHGGAYLGVAHNPFRIGDFSYGDEAGRLPSGSDKSFSLVDGLTSDRMINRVSLLEQFDQTRRDIDASRTFDSLDNMNRQAQEIVLSGTARKAFDLTNEDAKTRERYGDGWGEQALIARRLIEAGCRFVTLNTGYWDDHGQIGNALNNKMPRHDRAVGTLIADLAERGMLDDTLVITAGEFGRTPKMNNDAGRDHWPQAQSILIAGGGYPGGQIIGKTNKYAEYPTDRLVKPADFNAIVYHSLGLQHNDTIVDRSDRPIHLYPDGEVPREML